MACLSLSGLASAAAQERAPVPAVHTASRAQVLALYRDYYLTPIPATGWTGSFAGRQPGTVSDDFLRAVLRRINYYRAMSGLRGEVVFDPRHDAACQEAALMIALEGHISHHPPASWKGRTPAAVLAAANSSLCMNWSADLGPGAVDRFMAEDEAVNAAVGHRRWLLYPAAGVMGAGAVPTEIGVHPGASAVWTQPTALAYTAANQAAASARDLPTVTAWPPPGCVPAPLLFARWSFSCANADFRAAAVRVTKNGRPLPVTLERLQYQTSAQGRGTGVGLNTLAWRLPGNAVHGHTDETYQVRVSQVLLDGAQREFSYSVVSIDPASPSPQDVLRVRHDLAKE